LDYSRSDGRLQPRTAGACRDLQRHSKGRGRRSQRLGRKPSSIRLQLCFCSWSPHFFGNDPPVPGPARVRSPGHGRNRGILCRRQTDYAASDRFEERPFRGLSEGARPSHCITSERDYQQFKLQRARWWNSNSGSDCDGFGHTTRCSHGDPTVAGTASDRA